MTTIGLNTKIPDHAEYITTQEFNKFTAENFAAKKKANLVSKTDFDNKRIGLNRKITSNKTKYLEVYYCFSTAIQLPFYIVKNFLDIK